MAAARVTPLRQRKSRPTKKKGERHRADRRADFLGGLYEQIEKNHVRDGNGRSHVGIQWLSVVASWGQPWV